MAQPHCLRLSIASLVFVAGSFLFAGQAAAQDLVSGDPGFGRQFVRDNPYMLSSVVIERFNDYSVEGGPNFPDLGLNSVITNANSDSHLAAARFGHDQGLTSFADTEVVEGGDRELSPRMIDALATTPGNQGFLVEDEPSSSGFAEVGAEIDDLRAKYPNKLLFSNAFPSYVFNAPNVRSKYQRYIDDFVQTIQPDVMMYDHYPFWAQSRRRPTYFSDLMTVREASQEAGIPYFAFTQSFNRNPPRIPSGSDIRMQAFSLQTAGYKGLSYFNYNPLNNIGLAELDDADFDAEPTTTVIYDRVKDANPELQNLGRPLRFLESTAVRFVPGQSVTGQTGTHDAPQGLEDFSPGAGSDPHIEAIEVLDVGEAKDGLIGLFTDDRDQHAFMLTNIYQDGDLTPEDAELDFEIVFDGEVDQLLKISRETGEQETVDVIGNTLSVTLPGGTGNLYKYDTGDFVVPEPSTLALLGLSGLAMLGRRRRGRIMG